MRGPRPAPPGAVAPRGVGMSLQVQFCQFVTEPCMTLHGAVPALNLGQGGNSVIRSNVRRHRLATDMDKLRNSILE